MRRYEVSEVVPDSDKPRRFAVHGPVEYCAVLLTEAVAHIMAFSLNAVADGKKLASPVLDDDGMYRYGGMYDGPTEGITQVRRAVYLGSDPT